MMRLGKIALFVLRAEALKAASYSLRNEPF